HGTQRAEAPRRSEGRHAMSRRDESPLESAREEAERLIAAALAAASFATRQARRAARDRDRRNADYARASDRRRDARDDRDAESGRGLDDLGRDLAGLASAATRIVSDWVGSDRDRNGRRDDTWDEPEPRRRDGYDDRDV